MMSGATGAAVGAAMGLGAGGRAPGSRTGPELPGPGLGADVPGALPELAALPAAALAATLPTGRGAEGGSTLPPLALPVLDPSGVSHPDALARAASSPVPSTTFGLCASTPASTAGTVTAPIASA